MSLSEFSYYLRRYGPVGILGFVLFVLFFLIMNLAFKAITSRPQTQVFIPAFGQLEPINFSVKVDYPPNPQFVIDNIEGRPTTATNSASIFYIPPPTTRFGYVQNIILMARGVGFDPEFEKYTLGGTQAVFENERQKMDVDIRNFNFTFETKFDAQPELFTTTTIPLEQVISEQARAFLRRMDRYPDALAQGTEHIIYLNFNSVTKEFTVVEKPQEANVVEVDFYPPNIDGLPVLTPKYFNSQNYVVMVFEPKSSLPKVIKAQIRYFDKDVQGYTYPLKSGDEAWAELTGGKGTIVSAGENSNKITIRQMFVGYFEPDVYQTYLQPVYVFLGDNNFAAYVPAVGNYYVSTASAGLGN